MILPDYMLYILLGFKYNYMLEKYLFIKEINNNAL